MSQFDDDMTVAADALRDVLGEAVTWRPVVGDAAATTAIAAAETVDTVQGADGAVVERVRRVELSLPASEASPKEGDAIEFRAETWTVVDVVSRSAVWVRVVCERPEVHRMGRPGYREEAR